jgi:hypothetical protein
MNVPRQILQLLAVLAVAPMAFAVTVNETNRTVQSTNLLVTWSGTDQEAIVSVQWSADGDPQAATNIASSWNVGACPIAFAPEYWGNSWESGAPQAGEGVLVGIGTTTPAGEVPWSAAFGKHGAELSSQSSDCSIFDAAAAPVTTRYRFYDHGPRRNVIRLDRTFSFEDGSFEGPIRPYMPRLSLSRGFVQVLYPSNAGALASVNVFSCPFGCVAPDWQASRGWYAIENPGTGQGVIFQRAANGYSSELWIDYDGNSFTNATSFRLQVPPGGFVGRVIEREVICFYDSSIWSAGDRAALELPAGCSVDAE